MGAPLREFVQTVADDIHADRQEGVAWKSIAGVFLEEGYLGASDKTVAKFAREEPSRKVILRQQAARRAKQRDEGSRREQATPQNLNTAAPIAPQRSDSVAPVASTAPTEAPNFSIPRKYQ